MTDIISRQTAIKAIDDLPNCYNGYSDTYDKAYIIGVLEGLPTIDPVKHGRWVCGCCDQCGYILHSTGLTNYCPNCGAKVEGKK